MDKISEYYVKKHGNPLSVALNHLVSTTKGLTKKQLSQETGISQPYLSELASGKKEGAFTTWEKIADFFNMSFADFMALGENLLSSTTLSGNLPSIQVNMTSSNTDRFSNDPLLASIKLKLLELEQRNHQKLKEIDIYLSGVIAGLPATARV
ncbi:MAG: helix-turn-helix transcriptional regulator [Desulfamplus sp.]|nr:helix-turn-helix transcriptional regulator [Desulfamplus sp.]